MDELRREMSLADTFTPEYLPIDGVADLFPTHQSRVIVLIALIRVAYADDVFDIEEQCFIQDLCTAFNISTPQFTRIDNWVKRLVSLQHEASELLAT